jgi:DNA helicase-2/ATP-dependent DNA helicase PcrA
MSQIIYLTNEPQRQAVACTQGPLLILAGAAPEDAGADYRIAHLIADMIVPPWSIWPSPLHTGGWKCRSAWPAGRPGIGTRVSTFQSMCAGSCAATSQARYKSSFSIYDEDDSVTLLKR